MVASSPDHSGQQEPYIIHENVERFNIEVLRDLLGDLYEVQTAVLTPSTLGWPIERRRRITVMTHRTKVLSLVCPWSDAALMFDRPSTLHWECFFVAPGTETEQELAWARRRKAVVA
eukprot:10018602-Alexandrium_andersonii.AAC.1